MSDEREVYSDGVAMRDTSLAWEAACSILFGDRHFYERTPEQTHPVVRQVVPKYTFDGEEPAVYRYLLAPADAVAARLRVYGYSDAKLRQHWHDVHSDTLQRLPSIIKTLNAFNSGDREKHLKEAELIKNETYDDWRERFMSNVREQQLSGRKRLIPSIVSTDMWDCFAELAVYLEAVRPKYVWIDVSDLYSGEAFQPGVSPQKALAERDREYQDDTLGNILVLTEGKSDVRIIKTGLELLYPDLADMFSFVDFEGFRIEGGASPLARMVKSFAGVPQATRIVAVFDNDAAGYEALNSLSSLKLPNNMRLISLPDIDLCVRYPTIGPEGLREMNVNGSAGTIELFLGREALSDSAGHLLPIRWSQWNKQAGRYQGSIEHKTEVEQRFFSLAADPLISREELLLKLPEMNVLLQTIFRAFE